MSEVIGRQWEQQCLTTLLSLGRHLLLEGPVGVGKTFLVVTALHRLNKGYFRVDGDGRYTEQKLTGWFDPPIVLQKGYLPEAFVEGPLVQAMKTGSVLFVNELNRMPESVQNILLPAMDEGLVTIPKVGEVRAKAGFSVVATQNPREFTATHSLSEALLDRFEMVTLDYQTKEEEASILKAQPKPTAEDEAILAVVRTTRSHPAIKRGASIRGALAVQTLVANRMSLREAALIALPSRIELLASDQDPRVIIQSILDGLTPKEEKKNEI